MLEENLILQNQNNESENIFETKLFLETQLQEIRNLEIYLAYTNKVLKIMLICFLLFFLAIPLFVALIIELIWIVKTLSLKNKDLKNSALIWGLFELFIIPIIPIFIMKCKISKYLKKIK